MILSTLKSLALGVWLGALLMLGYAVAGPLFQNIPSKDLAGRVNGIILGRMNSIEWVCATIALVTAIVLLIQYWSGPRRKIRIAEVAILILSTIGLWMYSVHLTGGMEDLRKSISFDTPLQTPEYVEAHRAFDDLHHKYTTHVGMNIVLLLAAFALSIQTARDTTGQSN